MKLPVKITSLSKKCPENGQGIAIKREVLTPWMKGLLSVVPQEVGLSIAVTSRAK